MLCNQALAFEHLLNSTVTHVQWTLKKLNVLLTTETAFGLQANKNY